MARRVSDYRIRRIADRGNEEDGPDSRARGDRFYRNRRSADRGNEKVDRDPRDIFEIKGLRRRVRDLKIQHEIRQIRKRIRELELQRDMRKETESSYVVRDDVNEEEEYPSFDSYPRFFEPIYPDFFSEGEPRFDEDEVDIDEGERLFLEQALRWTPEGVPMARNGAGEVKVKQVNQSKDDLREAEGVVNLLSPFSSINTPSLDIRGDEYSRTDQEKHHENTTNIVEKPVPSEVSEQYSDSKPPKQQLVEPMTPKKQDSVGVPMSNVEKQENTANIVEKPIPSEVSEQYSDSKPPKQQLVEPMTPTNLDSVVRREGVGVPTSNVEKQDCNFGKGRWVTDDSRPLYSGFGCKQWLSGMWACRLTQRTDFGYEKLKWQPKDCEMDSFTGIEFLKRMQDKTVAFVGDSLGRQQFQSLMCMITGGEERHDVEDVGKEYGLVKARGSVRPDGWAYRFQRSNTTILYYWSASLCDLKPLDPTNRSTYYAMHLDRPPAFLQRYLGRFHVVVLNTGHHWNRGKLNSNRWIMYVGGKPNTNRRIAEIAGAKNFTVYSIVNWVNGELAKHPGLKAFLRSISPRHFFNGDWNSGGTCDSTTPGALEVVQEESSDSIAAGAVKGTDVKLLDVTALSEVREEGHISRYSIRATPGMQDCLHWCLPGIPDTWNELLFAQI